MTISDKEYFDARFSQLETQIKESSAQLEAKIHATIVSTVKWCASIAATTVLIFTTVVAFLMNNSVPRAAPQTALQQPTVIVVPQVAASHLQSPQP